jgi:hypothetical protein
MSFFAASNAGYAVTVRVYFDIVDDRSRGIDVDQSCSALPVLRGSTNHGTSPPNTVFSLLSSSMRLFRRRLMMSVMYWCRDLIRV